MITAAVYYWYEEPSLLAAHQVMPPEPLAALRHATAGKLQVKSHGLRLGQRYQVRVAECGCGPFRITVRCRGSECESTGVCQCRNTMLVFQHPSFCSHVDVVGGDTEADGPAAAAQGPPNDTEDVGPPPWWGADFDAKFAEVLRVTNTSPHYIDDRLLEQIVVKVRCTLLLDSLTAPCAHPSSAHLRCGAVNVS